MKTFVILGMHRSATSLVSKGLYNEISMGQDLFMDGPGNPKGHYEDKEFMKLNEFILNKAGGTWYNPPSEDTIESLKYDLEIINKIKSLIDKKNKIAEQKENKIWGWKDPRTVITISLYLSYIINPHFIFIFRNPNEIAKSLVKREREDFTMSFSLRLAKEYHRRMVKFMNNLYESDST